MLMDVQLPAATLPATCWATSPSACHTIVFACLPQWPPTCYTAACLMLPPDHVAACWPKSLPAACHIIVFACLSCDCLHATLLPVCKDCHLITMMPKLSVIFLYHCLCYYPSTALVELYISLYIIGLFFIF
jgi:hypothetical protein